MALSAMFALVACSDDDDTKTPPPAEPAFTISVVEKTMTGAKIEINEISNTVTYYVSVDNKTETDVLCPTDEAYFSMKLDFIKVMAGVNGQSVSGYLQTVLKSGASMYEQTDLYYDTEYYVCAFGLNTEGEVTTPLVRETFRTATFAPSETCEFIIQPGVCTPTTIQVVIGASDPTVRYFVSAMTEEGFAGYDSVNDAVADLIFSAELFDDVDWSDPSFTFTGRQTLTLAELESGTKYVIFAFGVDSEGGQTTEAATATFATLAE